MGRIHQSAHAARELSDHTVPDAEQLEPTYEFGQIVRIANSVWRLPNAPKGGAHMGCVVDVDRTPLVRFALCSTSPPRGNSASDRYYESKSSVFTQHPTFIYFGVARLLSARDVVQEVGWLDPTELDEMQALYMEYLLLKGL